MPSLGEQIATKEVSVVDEVMKDARKECDTSSQGKYKSDDKVEKISADKSKDSPSQKPQVSKSRIFPESKMVQTQTDTNVRKYGRKPTAGKDFNEDLLVNAFYPPPLFYNGETTQRQPQPYFQENHQEIERYFEDNFSEDTTIRIEDKYSDDESAVQTDKSKKARRVYETAVVSGKSKGVKKIALKPVGAQRTPSKVEATNPNFPILNALLEEIMRLQGFDFRTENAKFSDKRLATKDQQARRGYQSPIRWSTRPAAVNLDSPRHKPHSCTPSRVAVPKDKGWLHPTERQRSRPQTSTLAYGITHTQKLRLSKVNPELLQEIERRENERLEARKRLLQLQKGTSTRQSLMNDIFMNETDDLFASVDSRGHQNKRPVPTPRASIILSRDELKKQAASIDKLSQPSGSDATNGARPQSSRTPSPRKSVLRSSSEEKIKLALPADETADGRSKALSAAELRPEENKSKTLRTSLSDSCLVDMENKPALGTTVTIAKSQTNEEAAEQHTTYSDDFDESILNRTSEIRQSAMDRTASDYFEQHPSEVVLMGEEPDLRKVVDVYSDGSSDEQTSSHRNSDLLEGGESAIRDYINRYLGDPDLGEEPQLKKIVDDYLDDNSEERSNTQSNRSETASSERLSPTVRAQQNKPVKMQSTDSAPNAGKLSVPSKVMSSRSNTTRTTSTFATSDLEGIDISDILDKLSDDDDDD